MALDPYDYDEKDRPTAYRSRKKHNKCKEAGKEHDYETISGQAQCRWYSSFRYWSCACFLRCKVCTKVDRWSYKCRPDYNKHPDYKIWRVS